MIPEPLLLLQAAGIVMMGAVLQGSAGFGYGLFATPLLLQIGIPLHQAVLITAVSSATQSGNGAYHLRRFVPWRLAGTAAVTRTLFVFVGIMFLKELIQLNVVDVRFVVGCMVCVAITLQLSCRPKPVARLHPLWAVLAFPLSGVMAGALGMGGPPLVLWAIAHDWNTKRIRGFLQTVFAMTIPPMIVLFWFSFGDHALRGIVTGLVILPFTLLGSFIGLRIGHRLSPRVLRVVVYALLFAVAGTAIWAKLKLLV